MDPGTGDSCQQQLSGDVWDCGIEGWRAGQVSSICLSAPICIMGGTTCKAVKPQISSPSPTHQLSLLSSGQGEPVPLPAALCHLRRICRRRRPVVHAKRHQLPPTPDTLPLQRKASSRRARAVGPPGNLRGGGGGVSASGTSEQTRSAPTLEMSLPLVPVASWAAHPAAGPGQSLSCPHKQV